MNTEDWKLQASIKVGANQQHMINVRANTVNELCGLLDELHGSRGFVNNTITGVANDAPPDFQHTAEASLQKHFPETQQVSTYGNQPQTYGNKPAVPECSHGPMKYREGVSNKTGRPYKAYMCPGPQGQPQCPPKFLD